jgi:hypothetical protein
MRFLNKNNIIEFIIDCGENLDLDNIFDQGRIMCVPLWFVDLLHTTDIKDVAKKGWLYPFKDGYVGYIDRFSIIQCTGLGNIVEYGGVSYLTGRTTRNVFVQYGESLPSVDFDEWNW